MKLPYVALGSQLSNTHICVLPGCLYLSFTARAFSRVNA